MKEDKNIERFFKKRLESNEFSYQEEDWQELEKKLDAAGIVPPGSELLFSPVKLIIAGLIISSVAFFLGWFFRDNIGQKPEEIVEASQVGSSISLNNNEEKGSADTHENQVKTNSEAASVPSEPEKVDGAETSSDETMKVRETESSASEKSLLDEESVIPESKMLNLPDPFRDGLIPIETGRKSAILLPVESEKDELISSEKILFKDRWSIGLSVAPDLNSIGLTERKSVSPKFGVQVFYRLAEKWTISTGAFYNKKKYETDAEGYSPPDGYWYQGTNGMKPANIIGSCGVVDIPIKIYYKIFDRNRFDFYATIGTSNYFLLDESYDFEFDQPNYGSQYGWYTDENSSVLAGMINTSVLVGLRVTQRSELFAEPYLQIPRAKIGWGNVNLYSTGILFTWRYKLFRPPGKVIKP